MACPECGSSIAPLSPGCLNKSCSRYAYGVARILMRPLHGLLYAVTALIGVQLVARAFADLGATSIAATLSDVTFLAAGVCALVFLYRARVNLDALPEASPRWSTGWVIGAWLVPIANIVLAPLVLADIAKPSVRRRPIAMALVVGWAVAITATALLGLLYQPVAALACAVVAGVLFVLLLWLIADGQREIAAQRSAVPVR
jgi:hypothetical protein